MFLRQGGRLCRKAKICEIMDNFSFEVTPSSAKKVASFMPWKNRKINCTFLPGTDKQDTIDVIARLHADGAHPIPHLAARSFKNLDDVEDYLRSLSKYEVKEVLVIGGGVDTPVGDIADSLTILQSGLLEKYGIERVGMAAHPEGSPDIKPDQLQKAMHEKLKWAHGSKFKCYWATQMCFSADSFKALREFNSIPMHVGLPGPTNLPSLIKFATFAGVGNSVKFLTRHTASALKLMKHTPDELIEDLSKTVKENNIECLHFYTFGGVQSTVDWAEKVRLGNFELKNPIGFAV